MCYRRGRFVSAGFTLLFSSHAPCEIGAHTSSFPVCLGWMGIMSFPAIAFAVLLPRIVETFVVVRCMYRIISRCKYQV